MGNDIAMAAFQWQLSIWNAVYQTLRTFAHTVRMMPSRFVYLVFHFCCCCIILRVQFHPKLAYNRGNLSGFIDDVPIENNNLVPFKMQCAVIAPWISHNIRVRIQLLKHILREKIVVIASCAGYYFFSFFVSIALFLFLPFDFPPSSRCFVPCLNL